MLRLLLLILALGSVPAAELARVASSARAQFGPVAHECGCEEEACCTTAVESSCCGDPSESAAIEARGPLLAAGCPCGSHGPAAEGLHGASLRFLGVDPIVESDLAPGRFTAAEPVGGPGRSLPAPTPPPPRS